MKRISLDVDGAHVSHKMALVCDKCGRSTRSVDVSSALDDVQAFDEASIDRPGWSRRVAGRMQRDYCPHCK